MPFCRLLILFKIFFQERYQEYTIRVPNSFDPDQARHFVGLDLGPNCYQQTIHSVSNQVSGIMVN